MPTAFEARCYALLRTIPKGRVSTYKLLAEALGTRAYRAVGSALSKNPDLITVPCHRIVKSSGEIGGYAGGVAAKTALLEREGVQIKAGRVADFDAVVFRFEKL
jgi:methylated-DNA-[protein]-cysteine S-methyltransferase